MDEADIQSLIHESISLHSFFQQTLENADLLEDDLPAITLSLLALSHGLSVLTLISNGMHPSAFSLIRLQFEALVRSMWALQCATEAQLDKLTAVPSLESLQAGRSLPGISEMLNALAKSQTVHPSAKEMLERFRETLMPELNSFIHSGMLPFQLLVSGVPPSLQAIGIKNSNAISSMTAMHLALISGDKNAIATISKSQSRFANCLPPLLQRK